MRQASLQIQIEVKKVLAEKGVKLVQRLQCAERETLTTLPCANACGDFIPPFLIFMGPNHT